MPDLQLHVIDDQPPITGGLLLALPPTRIIGSARVRDRYPRQFRYS
jgi:hypothetical protein